MNQELLELKVASPYASMMIAGNFLEALLNGYQQERPKCNLAKKCSAFALYKIFYEKEAPFTSNGDVEDFLTDPKTVQMLKEFDPFSRSIGQRWIDAILRDAKGGVYYAKKWQDNDSTGELCYKTEVWVKKAIETNQQQKPLITNQQERINEVQRQLEVAVKELEDSRQVEPSDMVD